MSDVYKSPPAGDFDPHAEARKQITLDRNDNLQRILADSIDAVRIATPARDSSPNARMRYERNYKAMVQAARQVYYATGQSIAVPKHLPAPRVQEETVILGEKEFPFDAGFYHESGSGKKSTGVEPRFSEPESDQHQAWLDSQSVPPIKEDLTGKSPAEVTAARKKRAGVPS